MSDPLADRIHIALADDALRHAVDRATRTTLVKRDRLVEAAPDWAGMRDAARRIRSQVIEHLGWYLGEFERNATANGIQVHWAADAADASRIVVEIAKAHDTKRIVKSKSMVTEEIGLRDALAGADIECLETDLGEWIVQLADELPSHLTAPALHKSRGEIGRLFVEKLGIEYTDDPGELMQVARDRLRVAFGTAEVGITGANFGLAAEGSVVVVENEGNAALSAAMPNVRVTVMGIERLLPSRDALPLFLKLLTVSATGQPITTYVHRLSGPGEGGPKAVHVVLVDNGRTRMLEDPTRRELLNCIRCGACLNVCPIYQRIGGHAYGDVYQGPIGKAILPHLRGWDATHRLPFASSLCGACHEICPVGIDLPRHLLEGRAAVAATPPATATARVRRNRRKWRTWSWLMRHPRAYRAMTAFARRFRRLPSGAWGRTRDLPIPGRRSFDALWREETELTETGHTKREGNA